MPIDVAVEEPRTRVVGEEPDRDVITGVANAHDVTDDRVIEVVRRVTGAPDDRERVSMQVNRVLSSGRGVKKVMLHHWQLAGDTHRSTKCASRNG